MMRGSNVPNEKMKRGKYCFQDTALSSIVRGPDGMGR